MLKYQIILRIIIRGWRIDVHCSISYNCGGEEETI